MAKVEKSRRNSKGYPKYLDNLARTLLRLQCGDKCQRCNKPVDGRDSQMHHIVSRKYYSTRWEMCNLVLLCAACHRQYHDGLFGKDWFAAKFPKKNNELTAKVASGQQRTTWRTSDFEAVEARLLQELSEEKQRSLA